MELEEIYKRVHFLVERLTPELITHRRELHKIPEIAHQEFKTSTYIANTLKEFGITPRTGVAGTGLTAEFQGSGQGSVGFRCDIDGLPIVEETGLDFASIHPGKMHACGHDAHTAIGIGIARVLQELQEELPGRVRILFQPAEETQPGGAMDMIKDGAIEGLDAIFSLHVDPAIDAGHIGVKFGPHLASVDIFEIQIIGNMGHAAHPHLSVDAVLVAAKVVTAMHSIPSRRVDPLHQIVITISTIHGGEAKNVMPEIVTLGGTIRTLDEQVRREIPEIMRQIIGGITSAFDARYKMDIINGAPVLYNDFKCSSIIMQTAQNILGYANAYELPSPRMGSEDFSNYLTHIPGAMARLGIKTPGREVLPLHTPSFQLDEKAIPLGIEIFVMTLFEYLLQKNTGEQA
ncbi:amidohydrolase [candidate division KSB1 bacterium]|nr:amidohydrolase [candidate division KSB1 bacterium]